MSRPLSRIPHFLRPLSRRPHSTTTSRDIRIKVPHTNLDFGAQIFGTSLQQANEDPNVIKILATHGWLDNSASFNKMLPAMERLSLEGKKFCCVSMDLAGHGLSSHRPPGSPYNYASFASDVLDVAETLGWERYNLLGHSLGAAVSALVAGSFPERIHSMVMIDNVGPLSRPASEMVSAFRKHHLASAGFATRGKPTYSRIEDAIAARANGLVPMSLEGAAVLVSRGLEEVEGKQGEKAWSWRTDRMLLLPNAVNFTEETVLELLKAIVSPTLVIIATGEKAWLLTTFKTMTEKRLEALRSHHDPKTFRIMEVEGSHHLHLQEKSEECAKAAYDFFVEASERPVPGAETKA